MPARLLAMTMCLSVMNQCSVETDGRIELVLRVAASFDLSYRLRCLTRNLCTSKVYVLPSGTLSQTPQFCLAMSIGEMCYQS